MRNNLDIILFAALFFSGMLWLLFVATRSYGYVEIENTPTCSPTPPECTFNGFSHTCTTITPSESPTGTPEASLAPSPTAGESGKVESTPTPIMQKSEVMVMPEAPATGRAN